MSTQRIRSSNITDQNIEDIVRLLDGWAAGKLTWNSLIDAVSFRFNEQYTRQALSKHNRIKRAYDITKERIAGNKDTTLGPRGQDILAQKIERLEAENLRLTQENEDLLFQFARWAYNAYTKGITQDELEKPLPNVDRR